MINFNHWFIYFNHWFHWHSELRHSTLWHSSNSYPINIHPAQKSWRHTNLLTDILNLGIKHTEMPQSHNRHTVISIIDSLIGTTLYRQTFWTLAFNTLTFFKQLSNKHSSSAEILDTHKLNTSIQIRRSRTEASRTKDHITKRILKPHSHSPNRRWSQTFCRQTFQIWALITQRCRTPTTANTFIKYTDI